MNSVAATPIPPEAKTEPHEIVTAFGAKRTDPYYWMRDDRRTDTNVIAHLEAENTYCDAYLEPSTPLAERLYEEIVGRVKQDDSSVPYRERGWWYYQRYETGKDYPIYARRQGNMDAPESLLLDVNALAEGKDYYDIGDWAVSPDNRLLAYSEDRVGRRQHHIRFKNLETGEDYADLIPGTSADIVWMDDSRTILYIENDADTLLTRRVKRHTLGTPAASDIVVYEEPDDSFYLSIDRSRDDRYLIISSDSTLSTELRYAPTDSGEPFRVLLPRHPDIEYQADHHGGRWIVRTNAPYEDGRLARNFRLIARPDDVSSSPLWIELLEHDEHVFIEDFEVFDSFIAVSERSQGLERIRIIHDNANAISASNHSEAYSTSQEYVAVDEPAYSMWLSVNSEPDTLWLRYTYTSLTTPSTIYEVNVQTDERRLLKQQPVVGYDPQHYATERIWADARDGTRIPVSLVYRRDFVRDGSAALLQYGYGSYGISSDPIFDTEVISLLDRGMVYAVAHVRGGQEMGRQWYESGRLMHKMNTFTDFIDVTDALVNQGYAAADRIAAAGGSAGGLLMGAIANMAPERYRVISAHVPFVDVVTTMLDPSIPLTTNEYDEWGNPNHPEVYRYLLTYSPYDNVRPQAYPALFVGTGLWDSQVQYWEPAKWVARLREMNTSDNPILFRINMAAGHSGKSGRFQRHRETAENYAFMLMQLGVE